MLEEFLYYTFWKMDIDKVSLSELKKNKEKYAQECTADELLDALNLCEKDEKRKQVIIDILNMQQQIQQEIVEELGNSELNLSTLLNKFHTDTDAYSLKHRLTEI